jgi:DNA-binding IclR family transcriptional regulator
VQDGSEDNRTTAIQKAFGILEALLRAEEPSTLVDLANTVEMPKASVHRLLNQMEAVGVVRRDLSGRAYLPGARWVQLASETLVAIGRQPRVREIMRELVGTVTESCNLAILQGNEVVYVERVECEWPLRMQLHAGSRVPVHCTSSGKLLLAMMEPGRRQRFVASLQLERYTPGTIVDREELLAECARIRQEGISINREEYHRGLIGVAVPVRAGGGGVAAALAIHAPIFRMNIESARAMIPHLRDAAGRIASEAGAGTTRPANTGLEVCPELGPRPASRGSAPSDRDVLSGPIRTPVCTARRRRERWMRAGGQRASTLKTYSAPSGAAYADDASRREFL